MRIISSADSKLILWLIVRPFILFWLGFTVLTGCKVDADKKTIHFEVANDSLYVGQNDYKARFTEWKKIYEECVQNRLFQNAIYMGLQENVHIGSIRLLSNQNLQVIINKYYTV